MEVSVVYQGRNYKYTRVGQNMTWVDDRQMVVPVMLHTVLRETAISLGADSSIFLGKVEKPKPEKKSVAIKKQTKTKKKSTLKGGFNPFNTGER